jgi:hypothetical protein
MRAEQTVNEMAQVVLWRQAKAQAQRTGHPAGCQLEELRSGAHQYEQARYWQLISRSSA